VGGGNTVVAVGDIHGDGSDSDSVATNALVNSINPVAVLGLGDYQYSYGTCSTFMASGRYNSDWSAQTSRMYATFGPTHDYNGSDSSSRADLYFSGKCGGQPTVSAGARITGGTQAWYAPYSFNVGSWHIIQLPSTCERYSGSTCSISSVNSWLVADLAANPASCTIAYTHEPYWSSPTGEHTRSTMLKPWIDTMYAAGVDVLLSGHQHMYERFAPQNPSDATDTSFGLTEFIVGTGGIGFYPRTGTAPNSVAYQASTYGVLRLTLSASSADFRFMPAGSGTYSDAGTVACHGRPGSAIAPTTYYVAMTGSDAATGSLDSPFRTIQHAVDVAPAGSEIQVRGGTYAGFSVTRGDLTVKNYPHEIALVSDSGRVNVISVSGVKNVTLQTLAVEGGATQWGAGIRVENSSGVTIDSATLRNNRSFGIKLKSSSQVTIRNSDISGNETGIEVDGGGANVTISSNAIHDNNRMVVNDSSPNNDRGANGVVAYHVTGPMLVTGNRIWGNRATSMDYGYDGGAFEVYGSSNITYSGNTMWDNENVLETGTDGAACDGIRFTRNTAYGAASVPGHALGLILRCASNSLFAHNTLDGLDVFAWDVTAQASSFGGSIDGLRIVNNVVTACRVYSIDSALPASVQIDYNLGWNPGGTVAYVAGRGSTASLATFQSWTGYETRGVSSDPLFVAPGDRDYTLQATSPAIDRGLFLGEPALGTAPDLGRFEVR
jgi:acid phosphatase type 7